MTRLESSRRRFVESQDFNSWLQSVGKGTEGRIRAKKMRHRERETALKMWDCCDCCAFIKNAYRKTTKTERSWSTPQGQNTPAGRLLSSAEKNARTCFLSVRWMASCRRANLHLIQGWLHQSVSQGKHEQSEHNLGNTLYMFHLRVRNVDPRQNLMLYCWDLACTTVGTPGLDPASTYSYYNFFTEGHKLRGGIHGDASSFLSHCIALPPVCKTTSARLI